MKNLFSTILKFIYILFFFVILVVVLFLLYTEHLDKQILNKKSPKITTQKSWYFEIMNLNNIKNTTVTNILTYELSNHFKKYMFYIGNVKYNENELSKLISFYNEQLLPQMDMIESIKKNKEQNIQCDVGRICIISTTVNNKYFKSFLVHPYKKAQINEMHVKNILLNRINFGENVKEVQYKIHFFDCCLKNGT